MFNVSIITILDDKLLIKTHLTYVYLIKLRSTSLLLDVFWTLAFFPGSFHINLHRIDFHIIHVCLARHFVFDVRITDDITSVRKRI